MLLSMIYSTLILILALGYTGFTYRGEKSRKRRNNRRRKDYKKRRYSRPRRYDDEDDDDWVFADEIYGY